MTSFYLTMLIRKICFVILMGKKHLIKYLQIFQDSLLFTFLSSENEMIMFTHAEFTDYHDSKLPLCLGTFLGHSPSLFLLIIFPQFISTFLLCSWMSVKFSHLVPWPDALYESPKVVGVSVRLKGGMVEDEKPLTVKLHMLGRASSLALSPGLHDNKI